MNGYRRFAPFSVLVAAGPAYRDGVSVPGHGASPHRRARPAAGAVP
jgi:hypothetical protein